MICKIHLQTNRWKRTVKKKEDRDLKVYDMLIYIVFNFLLKLSNKKIPKFLIML